MGSRNRTIQLRLFATASAGRLKKIRAEIETTGKSTVIDQIKAQIKAGNCTCEVTNPQGSCCLGNVGFTLKKELARIKGG